MLINIFGAKCIGIEAVPVTVEVDISTGIGIHLVGLADVAVKESLLRTMTALQSMGMRIPGKKIVINLAPADMHKKGSGYDVPIALGIIAASGQSELPGLGKYIIMGELGLDASIRDIPGALPIAELSREGGFEGCILPEGSAMEAAEYDKTRVYGVRTLSDVLRILSETELCDDLLVSRHRLQSLPPDNASPVYMDFSEIVGQDAAKRGMEVAAAGSHNVMMVGSPGSGKSSLAKALAGILPPMDMEEAVVTSKIYSVAGRGASRWGFMRRRPFRSPHYSASIAAIIGGGNGDNILPGEISLAQNGVLFLDEFAQLPRSVAEALRGPLEDRKVIISRLRSKVEYPASFMLVAAANPCPCGYWGEGDRCQCTPGQRQSYFSRFSGPILDRIDVHLWLRSVETKYLIGRRSGESSAVVAKRVARAREIQRIRFLDEGIFTNSEMNNRQMHLYCPLDGECSRIMERIIDQRGLSARAFSRIVKMARTIADLSLAADDSVWLHDPPSPGGKVPFEPVRPRLLAGVTIPPITPSHLLEAAGYRFLDRVDIGIK